MKPIKQHVCFVLLLLGAMLHTTITIGADQGQRRNTRPLRTTQQPQKTRYNDFYCAAENIIHHQQTTPDDVSKLIREYPEAISSQRHRGWSAFKGQTLAHWFINQRRFDIIRQMMLQHGERLNAQTPDRDKARAGSTPFLALCMQEHTDSRAVDQQCQIAEMALRQDPRTATLARRDGMTPILAAACALNGRLMELIRRHHPAAYTERTHEGETVASIMLLKQTTAATISCIQQAINADPRLLSSALVHRLITSSKITVLHEIAQRYRLPVTDAEITDAWLQASHTSRTDDAAKSAMHAYLSSRCPWLSLPPVRSQTTMGQSYPISQMPYAIEAAQFYHDQAQLHDSRQFAPPSDENYLFHPSHTTRPYVTRQYAGAHDPYSLGQGYDQALPIATATQEVPLLPPSFIAWRQEQRRPFLTHVNTFRRAPYPPAYNPNGRIW